MKNFWKENFSYKCCIENTQHIHNETSHILQGDTASLGKQFLVFEGL